MSDWKDAFRVTHEATGVTALVTKCFFNGRPSYSVRWGYERKDSVESVVSKMLSFVPLNPQRTAALPDAVAFVTSGALTFIMEDAAKEAEKLERDESERRQALSKPANPGLSHKRPGLKSLSKIDSAKRKLSEK